MRTEGVADWQEHLQPVFTELAELPTPISSASASGSTSPAPEYPSALPVSPTQWVVNSGSGTIYCLTTSSPGEAFTGTLGRAYDLAHPYLLQAARIQDEAIRILVTRSILDGRKHTGFELAELTLPMEEGGEAEVAWSMKGPDAPVSCTWHDDAWLILSSEAFQEEEGDTEDSAPAAVETSSTSFGGIGIDTPLERPSVPDTPAEHPFSWTQTGDSATIRFTMSAGTQRSDLTFSLGTSSFKLGSRIPQPPALTRLMSVTEHAWWAPIDIETSSLSYDPVKAVLEVDIAKAEHPNRWPSLFLPSDDDSLEDGEFDVPETLDASVLAAVRATFDSIKPKGDGPDEPAGNHPAIPSLLREEMDFDMEEGEDFDDRAAGALGEQGGKVGRDVFVGRVKDGKGEWSKTSAAVVSMPFDSLAAPSLVIKSAVDGLIFTPPANGASPAKKAWTHTSTVPALAFVLSSKRDIRLVRHLLTASGEEKEEYTVLAFDAGGAGAGQGNVYVYYPPDSKTVARQGLVRVSGGERGALLGLGSVPVKGGRKVIVALCENELVVLHNIL